MFVETNKCSWCDKELDDYYLTGHSIVLSSKHDNELDCCDKTNKNNIKLCFCNFVCAKHYNDIVGKIFIDFDKYSKLYYNNKLDKLSSKIFRHVVKQGFEYMPTIYNTKYDDNVQVRRDQVAKYIYSIYDRV